MNAVISVIGKDCVCILAYVSDECAKANAYILYVSQSVLKDYFAMIMVVNIDSLNVDFTKFVGTIEENGKKKGLEIHVMHEDIFNAMHKI